MRKKYIRKNTKTIIRNFIVQIWICIIIIILVISIKKADITMTNKFLSIIETGLKYEYDFKNAPGKAVAVIKRIPEIPLKTAKIFTGKNKEYAFNPPIDQGEVISTFGSSYDVATETSHFQRGIDYYSSKPMDVYAIGDGIVTEVGNSNVYGNYVKIHHGEQIFSIYGGCSSVYVKDTQKIKKGDILASIESVSSDPQYFHFELWVNGEIVNPEDYIDFN